MGKPVSQREETMVVGDMLVRNRNKFPEKTAIVADGEETTYKALNSRVNSLAGSLIKMGAKKGDRVGVLVHNCRQFVEIYFASAKVGTIFCPYNNHVKAREMGDIIAYSKPGFLFLDADWGPMIESLKPEITSVNHYICLQTPQWAFMKSYEETIAAGSDKEPGSKVYDDDVLSMYFTAGTTGRPKGALRTHRHLVMNGISRIIELNIGYNDKPIITFPMYHVACEDNIVSHFHMPNTMHIRREGGFSPAEMLDYISKNRITMCQMVPTMVHATLQVPEIDKYDLSSLRLICYAGSSMPVELLKRALKVFKCGFAQFYGQTESGPFTTVLKPEDHILDGSEKKAQRLASSGKAVFNYELRIVDEDDLDVPLGEVGELIGRSESMMKGYWELPEETEKKLKGGWLHTGDLAKMDEDSYVYIVERKNDMIISGGVNIYPREIEEILYKHPAILEAQVIGVKDEYWGEVPKAVVVLREGSSASGEEIIKFCGEHLAGYKKPKSVEFWKELPKSPQGKILKKVIRESFK
jgi:long-chain acyl-CoA synthetase